MSAVPSPAAASLISVLRADGHCFVRGAEMRTLLAAQGDITDWAAFADSWERMPLDGYMADGGRYRRRRHGSFEVLADSSLRWLPQQPHYQSRDYNPLNGGLERWFEALEPETGHSASLATILHFCAASFGALAPAVGRWHVEVHQFRIEARADMQGQPTPEGIHRDGVDFVLVLLIRRRNIASGTTTIHAPDGRDLGSFTLTEPFDATLLDDRRVFHGVTPVTPLDPAQPACRDVLVVTFRAI